MAPRRSSSFFSCTSARSRWSATRAGGLEIRAGDELLEHVGEAVHRVGVLGGAAGGGAEVRVGGGETQRAGEGGEGELGLAKVVEVDVGRLLEREDALELVLRHLGDEVERGDELPVLLDRLVRRDEGARGFGADRLVVQQRFQRRQGVGVVRLLVQDGGVRLDGIGTGSPNARPPSGRMSHGRAPEGCHTTPLLRSGLAAEAYQNRRVPAPCRERWDGVGAGRPRVGAQRGWGSLARTAETTRSQRGASNG